MLHLCGLKIRVVLHEFKLKLVRGGDFLLSHETLGKIAQAVTRCRELSVLLKYQSRTVCFFAAFVDQTAEIKC